MQSATSPDRSISDDALASGVPAGEGGFDPSKPFYVRGENMHFIGTLEITTMPDGYRGWVQEPIGRTEMGWDLSGVARHPSRNFDLLNTFPVVAPTAAGDMAGEDDAAFVERMANKPLPDWGVDGKAAIIALAREGARREPVVGDGWQPIETASDTRDIIWVVGGIYAKPTLITSRGSEWSVKKHHLDGLHKDDPTHWHPQIVPAAPGAKIRATPSPAASPNGAGSGSEPVALLREEIRTALFRRLGEPDHKLARWAQNADPFSFWSRESIEAAIASIPPSSLYAAPPASVDAVAVVTEGLHIVFDGPPGPVAGRFVEVETPDGRGFNAGDWREREDGYWELVLTAAAFTQKGQK